MHNFFHEAEFEEKHRSDIPGQLKLFEDEIPDNRSRNEWSSSQSIVTLLETITASLPTGDVYLFGGMIRDLAVFGKAGFTSDIDLVVSGDFDQVKPLLNSYKVEKNKFGGYRFSVGKRPVDIWRAEDTWAIKQGLVKYNGIASLTETTVLNWDGILMNWRTKRFLHAPSYFEDISNRTLDVVLIENPNPLGMVVRVLRHLLHKDAKKIRVRAVDYLNRETNKYSFADLKDHELASYGNSMIEKSAYDFFRSIEQNPTVDMHHRFNRVKDMFGHGFLFEDSK